MRRDSRQEKGLARWSLCCISLLVSLLLVMGCAEKEEPVDYMAILARVHEGDDRQEALEALSDAWYHSECKLDGDVLDIFLYGPKERDQVTIIGIYFKPQEEGLVVDHTGTLESYFLDNPDFGDFCQPPLQDAFGQNRES